MPKTRENKGPKKGRNKSTTSKIGGRKSSRVVKQMSTKELMSASESSSTRPKDKGKLQREMTFRGLVAA